MAEALAQVKKGLGKDAVILHTRTYRVGAVMGLGGKEVIEITASDTPAARGPRLRDSRPVATSPASTVPSAGQAAPRSPVVSGGRFIADPAHRAAPEPVDQFIRGSQPNAPRDSTQTTPFLPANAAHEGVRSPANRPSSLAMRVTPAPVDAKAADDLRQELASIKRLMGQVLQCSRQAVRTITPASGASGVANLGGMPEHLFTLYLRLQDQGVNAEIAETIAAAVRDDLTRDEMEDAAIVRRGVLRRLAEQIRVVGTVGRVGPREDSRPLTIAMVGPTGVGKTTTLAKLAAAYKLRQGKSVGLVTADTYRIAAVDQLRTYANIIGLPIKVAMTPGELGAACESFRDVDVILVDTAGRSQQDRTRLSELQTFVQAANPHETHLALSATASEGVLADAASRFSVLKPDRVVFTKLDEAVGLGTLVNVMHATSMSISYVTTGQEVPDQIELASADRLAKAVLDGGITR